MCEYVLTLSVVRKFLKEYLKQSRLHFSVNFHILYIFSDMNCCTKLQECKWYIDIGVMLKGTTVDLIVAADDDLALFFYSLLFYTAIMFHSNFLEIVWVLKKQENWKKVQVIFCL